MKREKFVVEYWKEEKTWQVIRLCKPYNDQISLNKTKREAIRKGVDTAKFNQPSQLLIKLKNGRIQEERTYPRKSDPRETVGTARSK